MRISKFSPSLSSVPGTLGVFNKCMLVECTNAYMEKGETENNKGSIERRGKRRKHDF